MEQICIDLQFLLVCVGIPTCKTVLNSVNAQQCSGFKYLVSKQTRIEKPLQCFQTIFCSLLRAVSLKIFWFIEWPTFENRKAVTYNKKQCSSATRAPTCATRAKRAPTCATHGSRLPIAAPALVSSSICNQRLTIPCERKAVISHASVRIHLLFALRL